MAGQTPAWGLAVAEPASIIGGTNIHIYSCSQTFKTFDFKKNQWCKTRYMENSPLQLSKLATPLKAHNLNILRRPYIFCIAKISYRFYCRRYNFFQFSIPQNHIFGIFWSRILWKLLYLLQLCIGISLLLLFLSPL